MYWLWMFIIAALAYTALSLMTRAYQSVETSYAAIFEYAYLISVGLLSWLFWGIIPNYLSAVGILLIIFVGVIIVLAPQYTTKE
jgi:drug/metabolite transporter (DMT)-like permease